jgi:hypothetical protein
VLIVRSRQLETALVEFVEEAALRLQSELAAGAEVPFELAARPARGHATPLYCYRPLTDAFIRERWPVLADLGSCRRAVQLLEGFEGLERYLLARDGAETRPVGAGGPARTDPAATRPSQPGRRPRALRAEVALRMLLEDVFAEQSDFDPAKAGQEERTRRALERLDCSVHARALEVTLLATLHGLRIVSPELALAAGLTITQPEALLGVPDAALAPIREHAGEHGGHLLVAFTTEATTDVFATLARGREVLVELLRALRLFGEGRLALGRLAWVRVGAGSWSPCALGWGGRPHGVLSVDATQEDELRAFCNLVARRRPRVGELAWALARFEMGCERRTELQALSDHLLALRALLEPEGPLSGRLAGRLAALCATSAERPALTRRVVQALELERATVAGTASADAEGDALVRELADHLRALLRDVICGHLDPDLVRLADGLLASPQDPGRADLQSGEKVLGDTVQTAEVLHVLG